ncbi:MAG: glycosyltransferase family 2 protein [Dysgonamonadaceae bacterium]|nr:glycosyltransferase family 2 protein [Dysgonamonadaceae bacterium]
MTIDHQKTTSISKKVVVITLNYNHAQLTIDCVNSVLKSSFEDFVVLVVDNGSAAEDYEVLLSAFDSSNIEITRIEKNVGYVGGVNHGLKEALKYNPGYFLIMNNDTLLDNLAIKSLVDIAIEYDNNAIVSGKVYNMDEPNTLQYIGQECVNANKFQYVAYVKGMGELDTGQYDRVIEMGMLDDIFWLLPRKTFDAVGYYSTDFFLYGEQNDYAFRAIKAGFRLIYTPNAKIWHFGKMTTADGAKFSPKVSYWQSYATMVLAFQQLSLIYFFRLYFKYIYGILKGIFNCLHKNKKDSLSNYIARLIGVLYFTFWIFHRKPNNGFNPYNK